MRKIILLSILIMFLLPSCTREDWGSLFLIIAFVLTFGAMDFFEVKGRKMYYQFGKRKPWYYVLLLLCIVLWLYFYDVFDML